MHEPSTVVIPIPDTRCRVLVEVWISGVKTRIQVEIPERVTGVAITPIVVGSVGWPNCRHYDHPVVVMVVANRGAQMMVSRLVNMTSTRLVPVMVMICHSF
jgi:hypothetical protein